MKNLIYILVILVFGFGCEDVLDIKPTDMIPEEAVKNDPRLVDAFLNKIYGDTRFQSGSDYAPDQALLNVMSGEGNVFAAWQAPYSVAMRIIDENGAHEQLEYWPYDNIRAANEVLEILEAANFDESMVIQKSAEARWLRAFMYFELVKRYGGVPLITKAQDIDLPVEELYVERNTEKEIYDFLASEMDAVAAILPESYSNEEFGKPTKWAALALKSRAMLYAGSIGKYGTVQLNGLLGIPESETDDFFQKSYEASMQIINNSQHVLYADTDPVKSYGNIFVNENDRNSEIIFSEIYDLGLLKTHSWNNLSMPEGFNNGWGSNNWMYLESFEKYEYQDGTSGEIDRALLNGNIKFDLDELVWNRDPRLLATAFLPESPWQDRKVYMHSKTVGTIPAGSEWPAVAPQRNRIKTGFLIKKRLNESILLPPANEDDADWIVFRLGEIYLNAAEAAFELGDTDEAKRLINIIRNRVNMPPKDNLSVNDIRDERFVELFNEEHRYWDLRRWRIAVEELNGKGFSGIIWEYYIEDDMYTLKLKSGEYGNIRTFLERNYYFPIGLKRLADNPNLVENPGY